MDLGAFFLCGLGDVLVHSVVDLIDISSEL